MPWKLNEKQEEKRLRRLREASVKQTLKYKKPEIHKIIIDEFSDYKSILEVSRITKINILSIEKAWINEFGKEELEKRNQRLLNTLCIKCPLCDIVGSETDICRHVMNSKDTVHKDFIKEQNERLRKFYTSLPPEELNPYDIADRNDIYCSPSYVRRIFREFPDYKEKYGKRRSAEIKQQLADGRRIIHPNFINSGPKTYGLPQEEVDKIMNMYDSEYNLVEVSDILNRKSETILKYWRQKYGKKAVSKRNNDKRLILNERQIEIFKKRLNEGKNQKELGKEFNISSGTARTYIKRLLTKEERKKWRELAIKNALLKSLTITGQKGKTGSLAENYCYELLNEALDYEVIHHDVDTLPPFEIDITIPELKIAVSWDGPFHRRAVFGEKRLQNTINRDKRKRSGLLKKGWSVIIVEDDNAFNEEFVKSSVSKIVNTISNDFFGITTIGE